MAKVDGEFLDEDAENKLPQYIEPTRTLVVPGTIDTPMEDITKTGLDSIMSL